ncbi:discoidin domain-containing protein [Microbulbifer thermotolerans]|uniref:discoidin domain-containing protein n=1 Tax=Microbulbifer thermotolerans TaxID=252514 RepID=UPI00224AB881|nr:discoidin domain-containing protein [Microbulbifer thermotolerans]MCX2781270.1 discoidin domain-containing protein [Microbulbifer thermotolerans]MCX2806628.1 discoidin domain-containing protein [Microbulbifer thermotolerans]
MKLKDLIGLAAFALVMPSFVNAKSLTIESASAWGNTHSSYPATNAIDGDLDWSSRWAASGSPVSLLVDLDSEQTVTDVGISWGRGDSRAYTFQIWAWASASGWTKVYEGESSGKTNDIEVYDIDDAVAKTIRVRTFENASGSEWTNIQEVVLYDNTLASGSGDNLSIEKAFDDGSSHAKYPASNVIDGDTSFASRWAASGSPANITVQLEEATTISEVGVAWGRGDARAHTFEIYARPGTSGSDTWTKVYDSVSSGKTAEIEYYDVDNIEARQIRIKTFENTDGTEWTNITEIVVKGPESGDSTSSAIPDGPDSSWTYCSAERETCEFSGVKELAYGAEDNWSFSIEVDGVPCNNSYLEDVFKGKTKSCWIRPANREYTVINNLDELKSAMNNSGQHLRMRRGTYVADELISGENIVFKFEGDDNYLDMTGVTVQVPTALLASMSRTPVHSHVTYSIVGNGNIIVNGTFENIYPNGQHDVTDFGEHNDDSHSDYWPARQMTEFKIWGDNNELRGNNIIIRGSYPYGYGDMFGKGSGSVVYLRKHAGINVIGDNTVIDGVDLTVLAFGHGIFMQGADNTVIRNSRVEGVLRLGADMYKDGANSLPAQWNYEQQSPDWYVGIPIVKDRMYNLTEDGIRAYSSGTKYDGSVVNTGSVYVENTIVDKMRNCFALVAASYAELHNVEATRCAENGYSLPSYGVVTNSRGDWAYAPLIQMPYGNEKNISLDITVLEPEHTTGNFNLTNIAGSGHKIILRDGGGSVQGSNSIAVGYAWDRWDYSADDLYRHTARDIEIHNYTDYPVVLTEYSSDITGTSEGKVSDNGEDNSVK